EAHNPVYRLLALNAARYALPTAASGLSLESPSTSEIIGAQRLAFYRKFVGETDPTIVVTLVDAIAKVGSSDARQTLEQLRAQQAHVGNAELLARTDKALADLERLISHQTPQPKM